MGNARLDRSNRHSVMFTQLSFSNQVSAAFNASKFIEVRPCSLVYPKATGPGGRRANGSLAPTVGCVNNSIYIRPSNGVLITRDNIQSTRSQGDKLIFHLVPSNSISGAFGKTNMLLVRLGNMGTRDGRTVDVTLRGSKTFLIYNTFIIKAAMDDCIVHCGRGNRLSDDFGGKQPMVVASPNFRVATTTALSIERDSKRVIIMKTTCRG